MFHKLEAQKDLSSVPKILLGNTAHLVTRSALPSVHATELVWSSFYTVLCATYWASWD